MDSNLILVGIGGGGASFVADAIGKMKRPVKAFIADCDVSSDICPQASFIQMGAKRLEGLGTGGDTGKGREAALESAGLFADAIGYPKMAIVVSALGGGFATAATNVILETLGKKGVVSMAILATPFSFEGDARQALAKRMLSSAESNSDCMVHIPLDGLFPGEVPFSASRKKAMEAMGDYISLWWKFLEKNTFISLGFERISAILQGAAGAKSRFSVSRATGENRAAVAVDGLFNHRLLAGFDPGLVGTVILGIVAGEDIRLGEITEISKGISGRLMPNALLNTGVVFDGGCLGEIRLAALFVNRAIAINDPFRESPLSEVLSSGNARGGEKRSPDASGFEGVDITVPAYVRRGITLDK